jgi:hypothetical protein
VQGRWFAGLNSRDVAIAIVIGLLVGAGGTYALVGPSLARTTTITSVATNTITVPVVTSNTQSWEVVKPNVTVTGYAANIPCGALRGPCIAAQSYPATLIRYQGTYYYVSYFGLNNVWYTIWYGNSTEYCVSPKVQWDTSCP